MKDVGVGCNVDELGRVVIPKEIRRYFNLTDGVDRFEFSKENDSIVLKKFNESELGKDVGIPRSIDKQGRVVIPKGLRDSLNIISDVDSLRIYVRGTDILLKKDLPCCIFCGGKSNFIFMNKNVCKRCISQAAETIKI